MGYGNPSQSWQDYENQVNYGDGNTLRDWGIGLLGGPIGWGALASGNQDIINSTDFGGLWKNTVANRGMTEDVYNTMSASDWQAFSKMGAEDQNSFIKARQQQIAQGTPLKNQQNQMIDQLQKFAAEMNMPVDQLLKKDEFAKMLSATTRAQSIQQGRGQGLGSAGYSQNAADASSSKALLGYQMQRQQLGNQALGQANDIQMQQYGMNLSSNALNSQQSNQYLAQQAANQQKMMSALLASFSGGAGLAGAAAGAFGKSGGGGGIGGGGYVPQANYGSQPNMSGGGPTYGTYGGSGVGYNYPSTVPQNTGGNY
jgi:hypothetical protein